VIVAVVVAVVIDVQRGSEGYAAKALARLKGRSHGTDKNGAAAKTAPVEIVADRPDTIRFSEESFRMLEIRTCAVVAAPPPDPLRLHGTLVLDPNRLVRVHSRFVGELVQIGTVEANGKNGSHGTRARRPLRYGDYVKKGDILAIVWSKEIGEKKSEMVDAISKLAADKKVLKAMESVAPGAIPQKTLLEQRRTVEADQIALARAERTLISWRLTEPEMETIRREADEVLEGRPDKSNDKTWAELEIRAPIDGLVVEKNLNEGSMVDTDDNIFQIADLSELLVLANVYEEDLPALRRIDPAHRNWQVTLKSDPNDKPRDGTFDLIGTIIDPDSHTGVVMGWLENSKQNLAAGQFITATVELPADPNLVSIPSTALIEQGGASFVFAETNAERREFTRRKVDVKRRWRHSVYVCRESAKEESGCGANTLRVGETVIASGVLELAAQLDFAKSRSAEEEEP